MKNFTMKRNWILMLAAVLVWTVMSPVSKAVAASTVGTWYSVWYAKKPTINTDWITGFGGSSANQFIDDVSGDGKADAVVFNSNGNWDVAISNGNGFNAGSVWTTGHGFGSSNQFVADVNGDGKKDAIVYFSSSGNWYVALSNGSGFNGYTTWRTGFGSGSTTRLMADVNGDGKEDAVIFTDSTGSWSVALSNGSAFGTPTQWISSYGISSNKQFLADTNKDGKADAIHFTASNGNWYAANSSGSAFGTSYLWTGGHGAGSQNQLVADGNGSGFAAPFVFFNSDVNGDALAGDWYARSYSKKLLGLDGYDFLMNSGFGSNATKTMQGNVTGDVHGWKASVAFYSSTGTWKVQPYHFIQQNMHDTWTAWNIKYKPLTLGSYQQYDSGNTAVIDEHLGTLADAKIDFLLLDQTNNIYVDDEYIFRRAKDIVVRLTNWNSNAANRDVKYANAIGGIQWSHDPETIEWEAGQIWNEFVNTPQGGTANHYYLNGKPLLVVYCLPSDRTAWENWTGDKTNSNRFTIRWAHSPHTAGTYGWEVRNGTLDHDEVMVVMPGWNNNKGATPVSRANGDYYTLSGWEKVLLKTPKPQIVIVNSFNEYAEENAVAITDTSAVVSPTEQWYDKSGVVDNYMYWNLTKNYINLLITSSYKASTLYNKGQGWYRWSYKQWDGSAYSDMTWDATNHRWKGSQAYNLIMADSQHPDTNDSVRTWAAPYAGTVRIQGTPKKQDALGDGVVVKIIKTNTVIWGPQTITTTTGVSHDFTTTVSAGDSIYFSVNKNGNNTNDTTFWDPIITYQ